jgi:hypothetical protein
VPGLVRLIVSVVMAGHLLDAILDVGGVAATAGMRVVANDDGSWNVVGPNNLTVGPFATQSEAACWIDKQPP